MCAAVFAIAQYMVLLTVLTYGEARALIGYNNEALAVIMEALLLGDLLHAVAAVSLAQKVGGWTGWVTATAWKVYMYTTV